MNRLQYLLTKLAEEAAEISQIALKTSQFGLEEKMPDQPYTNAERTHQELDDLLTIISMLNDEYQFNFTPNLARQFVKKLKIDKYYQYSKDLGLVRD